MRGHTWKRVGPFSICREVRQTLAKERYVDIDIDNCHPVLLYQILKANNIKNKYLKSYIQQRQTWFDEINLRQRKVVEQPPNPRHGFHGILRGIL